jgi:hypothetical protein
MFDHQLSHVGLSARGLAAKEQRYGTTCRTLSGLLAIKALAEWTRMIDPFEADPFMDVLSPWITKSVRPNMLLLASGVSVMAIGPS